MIPKSSLGLVARVSAVLLLLAVAFQVGRWTGQLESRSVIDTGNALIAPKNGLPPGPETLEVKPGSAASGDPVGQSGDIITPLNVRDPSALIMGPEAAYRPPSSTYALPPEPPSAPAAPRKLRKKPLPEGRLLELMKKTDATPEQPKVY